MAVLKLYHGWFGKYFRTLVGQFEALTRQSSAYLTRATDRPHSVTRC